MHKFSLYCKSYRNDLDRAVVLAESIDRFNTDKIPFYISVPTQDVELFKSAIPGVEIIEDSAILEKVGVSMNEGWVLQQVVKSNFWKLGLTENYLSIDSDCQFIKPFSTSDFMATEDVPYTVCHEQKELWNWSIHHIHQLGFNPKISFTEDRLKIMNIFNRRGVPYDFGPGPTIWSAQVWSALDEIMEMNNLNWLKLMQISWSEFTWYGETLLSTQVIPLYPREPLFKAFHYYQQYVEYKQQNITLEQIADNYLGIGLQSNWPVKVLYY